MLKATLLKQIVGLVLGASLASSGLAYAGVEGAPNPVRSVVDLASSNDETENDENGDEFGTSTSTAETPDEAAEGQQTAQEKRDAAKAFTDAMRDWTDCVKQNAQAQGDEETRTEDSFDPRDGCDERPNPHDFGLSQVPDQASDEGKQKSEQGRERGEEARTTQGKPSDVPGDDADSETEEEPEETEDETEDEGDEPDDTPNGKPSGVPGR